MNLSFGVRITDIIPTCAPTWQSAINDVIAAGAVVVAAAGNNNEDASRFTPANCSGVITVAATNQAGNRANYSNFGTNVKITAPGGDLTFSNDPKNILSTYNSGTTVPLADSYYYYQGTSMAAPHVTGVVSLMFSVNPSLTPSAGAVNPAEHRQAVSIRQHLQYIPVRQRHAGCRRGSQRSSTASWKIISHPDDHQNRPWKRDSHQRSARHHTAVRPVRVPSNTTPVLPSQLFQIPT